MVHLVVWAQSAGRYLVLYQHVVKVQVGLIRAAGPTQRRWVWVGQQAETGSLVLQPLTLRLQNQVQQGLWFLLLAAALLRQQDGDKNMRQQQPSAIMEEHVVHSPVHSQLSIESDSDMTESSGLLQEVHIFPPQRPRPLIIFIIGGPGSGKGSQTAKLTEHFGFRGISLDELLRRQLLTDATPGRRWELMSELMSQGELGTQEDTVSELRQQLIGQQEVGGVIVDGFPRDVHQALSFQEQVGSPDLVMMLVCSNEMLRGRLQRRAAQLGLLGDSSHTLQRRLDRFQRDIVSISRYYKQLHLLTQVDANRDLEAVFADLSLIVREKLCVKDQSAAFDTVTHHILLSTLPELDISGSALCWFMSYLSGDTSEYPGGEKCPNHTTCPQGFLRDDHMVSAGSHRALQTSQPPSAQPL
ncbi:adenylate kinase isoenzyme 5-like [Stegastes partitus]|uniref:Adenylate kinase isoenzyme 5-like n=1 Tax=Stegastes partitus TaxID=144197 RepID=A0A9Y4NIN6_9TELE|nr:PREDICTED: adenylate kinase isoenzyme 5-like [Stegastes partitus]